jgi:hypothetical protein
MLRNTAGSAGSADIKHSWPVMRHMTGDYIHSLGFAYGVELRGARTGHVFFCGALSSRA